MWNKENKCGTPLCKMYFRPKTPISLFTYLLSLNIHHVLHHILVWNRGCVYLGTIHKLRQNIIALKDEA